MRHKIVVGEPIQQIYNPTVLLDQYDLIESSDGDIFRTFYLQAKSAVYELTTTDNKFALREVLSQALSDPND